MKPFGCCGTTRQWCIFVIVTTMGLEPSPSGETFRTFVYCWKRRQGRLLHETTAV